MKKETKFTLFPSSKDKISVRFQKSKGKILEFVIQYYTLTKNGWRTIVRYDTSHSIAHRHIYHYKSKKKDRRYPLGKKSDYNKIYTQAYKDIRDNYKKLKQNFLHT